MSNVSRECEVLLKYARVFRHRAKFEQALFYVQQAERLVTQLGGIQRTYMQAYVDYEWGKYYRDCENWPAARNHLYAARAVFHPDENDPIFNIELAWGILSNLGSVEQHLSNLDTAEQMYLQCLSFFRELGSKSAMTALLVRLALLEEQRGNLSAAREYANEALHWSKRIGLVKEQAQAESVCLRLLSQEDE